MDIKIIEKVDPEIAKAILKEYERQKYTLELIASENIAGPAVMAAQGSLMTNKYAEGYPHRRYYGGCEYIDIAEELAVNRAKELFCADFANVQPHSGSQANMAVYFALLNPKDTILAMDLSHGGHLTHGSPASFSGRFFNFIHYGVKKETGRIDYDQIARLAERHRPKLIVAGASAYPRIIDFQKFSEISQTIGALFMVDMAHIAGLVAGGVHPSPVPFADVTTSTTHKTLRGPRGGLILSKKIYGEKINKEIFPGIQGGPLMHIVAAKAVAFEEASKKSFKIYQEQVIKNAGILAQKLLDSGINLVSGGTDNHMMLADLTHLQITGKDAQDILGQAGITVNKNAVPFETRNPFVTSGIRIGTPALTTRGMKEAEMEIIGQMIAGILKDPGNEDGIQKTRSHVREMCEMFPLYTEDITCQKAVL